MFAGHVGHSEELSERKLAELHEQVGRLMELTLLLVHSRRPLAPLDTVPALSPGRRRQSRALASYLQHGRRRHLSGSFR